MARRVLPSSRASRNGGLAQATLAPRALSGVYFRSAVAEDNHVEGAAAGAGGGSGSESRDAANGDVSGAAAAESASDDDHDDDDAMLASGGGPRARSALGAAALRLMRDDLDALVNAYRDGADSARAGES